jgi:long-subunit fatty acid transport protein
LDESIIVFSNNTRITYSHGFISKQKEDHFVNYKRRYFWAGIFITLLMASSAQAGGLYLYELGNPDVGAAGAGWQDWSEFGKVGVTVTSEDISSLTVDRNYKDTWHVAVGGQQWVAEPWLLTAGVAYDSSMVDDDDRTPDLPLGEA